MGKSKRKNRTEFRSTIGQAVVDTSQSLVQAKLQECINKGSMNSLERLTNILSTEPVANGASSNITVENDMDTGDGKNSEKTPFKARKTKKHAIRNVVKGTHEALLVKKRINKMKRRGQIKKGQIPKLRT